jgi:hypothetical protein
MDQLRTPAVHPAVVFVLIELTCSLALAALFLAVTGRSACKWQYAALGAIMGLALGPFIYAASVMADVEADLRAFAESAQTKK